MTSLPDQLVAIAVALDEREVPHAFGGAIALAYALEEPRATRDLDINIFLRVADAERVIDALPSEVSRTKFDVETLRRDDQVRLWWDETPIDLFFSVAEFHDQVAERVRDVTFAGHPIRVLDATDLATFKVLFDRTKDWLDLVMMHESGTLQVDAVAAQLVALLGDDARIGRLRRVAAGEMP